MNERVYDEIGTKALQKRDHELGGVSAVSCEDKQRDAHNKADEHLEIDLLFRSEPQVALLGDFRVIVDKTDARESDQGKQR